ncbi:Uncharacterised protein at_DN0637 [Pycnogonum litorale]
MFKQYDSGVSIISSAKQVLSEGGSNLETAVDGLTDGTCSSLPCTSSTTWIAVDLGQTHVVKSGRIVISSTSTVSSGSISPGPGTSCEDGTVYQDYCYWHIPADGVKDYSYGVEQCNNHGGRLARPTVSSINTAIKNLIQPKGERAFIGITRLGSTKWKFSDGVQVASGVYNFWTAQQEPDYSTQGQEDCIVSDHTTGKWMDENCNTPSSPYGFICEKIVTEPSNHPCEQSSKSKTLGNICYFRPDYEYRNHAAAAKECAKYDAALGMPKTTEILQIINNVCDGVDCMLGIRSFINNKWVFSDGTLVDPSVYSWKSGYPKYNRAEDCIFSMDGVWTDETCLYAGVSICQRPIGPATATPSPVTAAPSTLKNFIVRVGNILPTSVNNILENPVCYYYEGEVSGNEINFICSPCSLQGRYITVHQPCVTSNMPVCELEAQGKLV